VRARHRLSVLTVLVFIAGCAGVKPPEKPDLPGLVPSSLRAEATVEIKRAFSVVGRARVLAKSPASFRVEVFGPFGQTAALLGSDGETIYMLTDEGVVEYGRDATLKDGEIPYPLKPEEIVSFLLGTPLAESENGRQATEASRDEYGRLKSFTRDVEGRPPLKVAIEDYRVISGANIPGKITIDDGKRSVMIRYREIEVNPGLDEEAFRFTGAGTAESNKVD